MAGSFFFQAYIHADDAAEDEKPECNYTFSRGGPVNEMRQQGEEAVEHN